MTIHCNVLAGRWQELLVPSQSPHSTSLTKSLSNHSKQEIPAAADCPGTASGKAGSAAACEGCPNQEACASAPKGPDSDLVAIEQRMRSVRHKILVLSGKGGVGKSTFASQLAFALAQRDRSVSSPLGMGLLYLD